MESVVKDVGIEALGKSAMPQLLELFTGIFHPYIPPITDTPRKTKAVMRAILEFYGRAKGAFFNGIRKDAKLTCAALVVDTNDKPSFFALARLGLSLAWTLGLDAVGRMTVIHTAKPKYEDGFAELIILGTARDCQKQGLGRRIMDHIYERSRAEGFDKGVVLFVDKNTPAFDFYLREGFTMDREFKVDIGDVTLCWMSKRWSSLPIVNHIRLG